MNIKSEPRLLIELKKVMKQRRNHKLRYRKKKEEYIKNPTLENKCFMLMAQEACRGSHIHAKKIHEEWQNACKIFCDLKYQIWTNS